ncbi:MAG: Na+/H+ antiporter subunit E [Methanobacteriaceae archaeon]|nr:Na+/H+ antiporter subunit E [Methanobacteriaceae archaeon]
MFLSRIYYGILYVLVLISEIIKSSWDMSVRAVGGDEIKPIVVDIETVLARPISQTILANSITLTPGTLSVDLDSDNKIIKVAIIAPRDKKDVIPFEPYIKKMLE